MSMLGIRLNLYIGPTVPVPVPSFVAEAIDTVEVTQNDEGRSGFQITFRTGRGGPADLLDDPLLAEGLLKANMRAVVTVTHGAIPRVLSDGIITHQQLLPGGKPGEGKLMITGEDISVVMDREGEIVEHPAQPELAIVAKICLKYKLYGLAPLPVPPLLIDPPPLTERIPVQRGTDLQYLKQLAERFGYVFYIIPGPLPGLNIGYWGPPKRVGVPRPPLTVNMGPLTNVQDVQFSYDSQKPVQISGHTQDRQTNKAMPVQAFKSTRIPLAGSLPSISTMRKVLAPPRSGLSAQQALAYAQGIIDASFDQVVTAKGKVDALCYSGILEPRTLVGLRGAGREYNGVYYIKSVGHRIQKEKWEQSFELTREGPGSLVDKLPL